VIEFLTLENVQKQQVHNRMAVVYNEDVSCHGQSWAADFCRDGN